jgi:hypothetical protein
LVAFTGIGFDTSRAPQEGSDTPSSSATIIDRDRRHLTALTL